MLNVLRGPCYSQLDPFEDTNPTATTKTRLLAKRFENLELLLSSSDFAREVLMSMGLLIG